MKKLFDSKKFKRDIQNKVVETAKNRLRQIVEEVGSPEEKNTAVYTFNTDNGTVEITGISEETKAKVIEVLKSYR